jgi:hypothetical protein
VIRTPWRARIAAIALAFTLPAGACVLAGNPALLATTADGGLPLYIDPYNPALMGPPVLTIRQDPDDVLRARDKAVEKLRNDSCNALISGPGDLKKKKDTNTDALSLVEDRLIKFRILFEVLAGEEGRAAQVVRQSNEDADGQGVGADGLIVVYLPTFSGLNDSFIFNYMGVNQRISDYVSPEVLQAVTVLHELAHLTNANNHGRGDPDREFNQMILSRCFGYVFATRQLASPGGPTYQEP